MLWYSLGLSMTFCLNLSHHTVLQYKQFVLKVLFQIGVIVINESLHYVYAFELQLAVNIQSIQYFCSYLYVAKSLKPIEF